MKNLRTFLYDAYWPPFTPDIGEYDPEKAVKTATDMGANAIRMASVGKWAIYPSNIMPQHPELNGRDLLGETVTLAEQAGIKVIIYIPIGHALPYSLLSQYKPQWQFYIDKDQPFTLAHDYFQMRHFGGEEIVPPCLFGPYNRDILDVVKEVVSKYDADAIYLDGPYQGWCNQDKICQCPSCRKLYLQDTGSDLPIRNRAKEENTFELNKYLNWNRNKILETLKKIRSITKKKNLPLIINRASGMALGTNFELQILNEADAFLIEAEGGGIEGISIGNMLGKMVWNYTTPHTPWPRLTNSDRETESALEGYRSIAMGATPIVSYAGRFIIDPSQAEPVRELFSDMKKLSDKNSSSEFYKQACVISPINEHFFESDDEKIFSSDNYAYTFHSAITDAGIQSMILPSLFLNDYTNLDDFDLLCLPSNSVLTEKQADNIRKFINNGGSLIASGAATLYNANGEQYKNFMLADLFGANHANPDSELQAILDEHLGMNKPYDTYLDIKNNKDIGLLPQSEYCRILPAEDTQILGFTTFWDKEQKKYPSIISNSYGEGKVIYLNSKFETIYKQQKHSGWQQLIKHLLHEELKIESMIKIKNNDKDIFWTLSKLQSSRLLQIVNSSGTPKTLDIELPVLKVGSVSSLLHDAPLNIIKIPDTCKIIISQLNIDRYECIKIDDDIRFRKN
jgi:putative glycosyl hydrolase-like family 6 (GHL6) protein/glycosyl hydrolase family 42 (putative beta-galactosidase)